MKLSRYGMFPFMTSSPAIRRPIQDTSVVFPHATNPLDSALDTDRATLIGERDQCDAVGKPVAAEPVMDPVRPKRFMSETAIG